MFLKPYKIKSNTALKATERVELRQRINSRYTFLSTDDLNTLIPNKCIVNVLKLITYSGVHVHLYCVNKRPMFFEMDDKVLIPTVYAVWSVPNIVPYFTTHPGVLPKLSNGADLMLPGVVPQGVGMNMYGRYAKDTIVAVNLTTNQSAVAVGKLIRSSDDLYMCGGRGSAVKILHIFGDKLWAHEPSVTQQIPDKSTAPLTDDDFPELGSSGSGHNKPHKATEQVETPKQLELEAVTSSENGNYANNGVTEVSKTPEGPENVEDSRTPESSEKPPNADNDNEYDTALKRAFLTALKHPPNGLVLPILTSTFFKNHILDEAVTPIDLKKTKYKKLSTFLSKMSDEGYITVREETKGISKIYAINSDHPKLKEFIADAKAEGENAQDEQLYHSEMTELYQITDEVASFFARLNYKRGEGLPSVQIKRILREYVSKNNLPLIDPITKSIKLDECLQKICERPAAPTSTIFNILISKMKHTYEMRSTKDGMKNKPQIQMSLATRSGGKKVTLVSNVDCYGIIMPEFVKTCKQGAAASTTIVKLPNQNREVVQIQGNQVRFIFNLLTEKYKISPKQILGLDLAKPEKKKK